MQVKTKAIPSDLFASKGKEIERILWLAVRDAILKHKRAGNPIAVWKDGKVVIILPQTFWLMISWRQSRFRRQSQ